MPILRERCRRALSLAAVSALTLSSCLPSSTWETADAEPTGPARVTPDYNGFTPDMILADESFYNATAMSEEEIASFIAQVNKGCVPGRDGTPCLADATFTAEDREPSDYCPGGYEGGEHSAAQIIARVSTSCGINPQVLLTLIQKEQGLLTASGSRLSETDYLSAAGYACPDGQACDGDFRSFFRQLYGAASQFQRYRLRPGDYQIRAGETSEVLYNPDHACGSAPLTPANSATAALYNYTPYQPNDAALRGGDDCSSWGNLNFYGFFRTFFITKPDAEPSAG